LKRLLVLLCAILLLMTAPTLLAQHGGHGAGTGHPPTGASNPTPNTNDMSDFNRAIALQATPDQIARFQQLMKSTEAAKQDAQTLIHAVGASKLDSSRYADLDDTVEEAESTVRQFVTSFSTPQQSELKPQIKKLRKADSELSKQSKALAEELERSKVDDSKIANVLERLNEALMSFQSEMLDIGKEMGIQPQEGAQ